MEKKDEKPFHSEKRETSPKSTSFHIWKEVGIKIIASVLADIIKEIFLQ